MEYIINFKNLSLLDLPKVGGKNASLGEMIHNLSSIGVKVPQGFATTSDAYQNFLQKNQLDTKIYALLDKLNPSDLPALKNASKTIRNWILESRFSDTFIRNITHAYRTLSSNKPMSCAVRSSATSEDLPNASFAGQHDSYLNITGIKNILEAIKHVYASLFNERAIIYRIQNNFTHNKIAISAGIQHMIRSDLASSGVIFTIDTETGFDKVVLINSSYGLGEAVVQGIVNPDEFYIYKPALKNKRLAILQRNLGDKTKQVVCGKIGRLGRATKTLPTDKNARLRFSLTDAEVTELAKQAVCIEEHYKTAMDIEWAKDGLDGKLYIVQARPETVQSQNKQQTIDKFSLQEKGEVLLTGHSIGQRIGQGSVRIIHNPKQMEKMQDKEVLVADMTDPDWEPIMKKASAIITNRGGRTCHAAIVARELGIPAVVGCTTATTSLKNGTAVTVSCAEGETGYVYRGILPINVEKISVKKMPPLPIELYLNLAEPNKAFTYQALPNNGVGLVRIEFIISNTIGIHPQALLKIDDMPKTIQKIVKTRSFGYENPTEFYIEKLREGIATIAAAFFPKPVVVRFSDFKSNEYANLLGGKFFEPKEANPMIGFRGVSRYLSESFSACFALECEAIQRVREKMGLTNVEIMLPFLRTLDEAKHVTALLAKHGLKRGKNGLRIIMMCEIPSNAILAKEFLAYFDGFSIGSNDLTQLTLGLDRDSSIIANLFDERNPAVTNLLHLAIQACKKAGKHIAICGQAPSDYPDFARWLMKEGVSGISLNPDTIVETWNYLGSKTKY